MTNSSTGSQPTLILGEATGKRKDFRLPGCRRGGKYDTKIYQDVGVIGSRIGAAESQPRLEPHLEPHLEPKMSEFEQPAGEPAAGTASAETESPSETILLPTLWTWVRDLSVSLVIAGVVIVFLYQPVKVEGTSMMPRIQDQERIFINKFVYQIEDIERGDVIVFRYPYDQTKSYIKRVIGLPGDEVAVVSGDVFINGEKLKEPYLLDEYRDRQTHPAVVVPPGEYYVLGDRRNSSNDSRVWGPVPRNFIYGKAVFVYWPVDRLGFLP